VCGALCEAGEGVLPINEKKMEKKCKKRTSRVGGALCDAKQERVLLVVPLLVLGISLFSSLVFARLLPLFHFFFKNDSVLLVVPLFVLGISLFFFFFFSFPVVFARLLPLFHFCL
jgi:VIT1/CCC1 family predicted Fe2+/Mn2+ transporter